MYDIKKIQEQTIYNAVKSASTHEKARKIVYGRQHPTDPCSDATWVKSVMNRLENQFDKHTVRQIRMHCQCGYKMDEKLALLHELISSSIDLEGFANQKKAKAAGLFCANGNLFLRFSYCTCPMLADVDKLDTNTWCLCTTGYSKVLFEKAFGCRVDVQLLQSVKMGDDICLQKIIPYDSIW